MATFPDYDPIYSAVKNSAPNTRIIQFGDGYQQRLRFGLNQNPKSWDLMFDVKDADADIIEAFLNARGNDSASFDWIPPDSTITYKWICQDWSRDMYDFQRSKIKVTFRQVFEP
jgi:phage-related protein